jgi:hypothetical protein
MLSFGEQHSSTYQSKREDSSYIENKDHMDSGKFQVLSMESSDHLRIDRYLPD